MPLMNLFVVIIPMLLLSAVFLQIAVIPMNQSQSGEPSDPLSEEEPLALAIHITDGAFLVEAAGMDARTIARGPASDGTGGIDPSARAELASLLTEIASAHPDQHDVQIVAQEVTPYEEIIGVMDISRAAGLDQASLQGAAAGAP